jgi:alpha-1,6-mannosyltransferase
MPPVVVTAWGIAGVPWLGGFTAAIAAAAFLYWRMLTRAKPLAAGTLCAIVAAALAGAFFVPVIFSSDVYAYAAYGEMARIGLNPYAHAPMQISDEIVRAARHQWGGDFPICLYGPAFVALARGIVSGLAPLGPAAQLAGFRVAAAASFLLCVPLAYLAFPGDRPARLRAAATIGLNPVAIWCAAEGHNDAIALAAALAGFALVRGQRGGIGGALVALSATIKAPGAAAAVALAIADRNARSGAIAGLALAVVASLPLIGAVATRLAPQGTYAPQASLQAIFGPLGATFALAAAVVTGALLAGNGLAHLRSGLSDGWVWLALGVWVLIPNPYPWYGLWLVAVAALAPQTRAGVAALGLSLTSVLRYLPDAIATPAPPLRVFLGVLAVVPLLALVGRIPAGYNKRLT